MKRHHPLVLCLLTFFLAVLQNVYDVSSSTTTVDPRRPLYPIVMIPGIAGSGLFAQLTNASIPECSSSPLTASTFRVWASLVEMSPPRSHQDCWRATFSLTPPKRLNCSFSSSEDPLCLYRSPPGITISTGHPFSTTDFEYLDYLGSVGVFGSKYFADFVQKFRLVGYEDGVTLFGFPYDWRLPPWQMDLENLKRLIESARALNNKRVMIISHSLGSVITTYFLNRVVDQTWKNENIESFTSISGAFGGCPKVIRALLSGYNDPLRLDIWNVINVSLVPADVLREFHRTSGAMYTLAPQAEVYGNDTPVVFLEGVTGMLSTQRSSSYSWNLVDFLFNGLRQWREILQHILFKKREFLPLDGKKTTPTELFTLRNWTQLLPPLPAALVQHASNLAYPYSLQDPGVPVNCIWSLYGDESTEVEYHYSSINNLTNFDIEPNKIMSYGDHTLPLASLTWCTRWNSTRFSHQFDNLDHMFIFKDEAFGRFIVSYLTGFLPTAAIVA